MSQEQNRLDELSEKVWNKFFDDAKSYENAVSGMSPESILYFAPEVQFRNDVAYVVGEETCDLSEEQFEALLKMRNPFQTIHAVFSCMDSNRLELIREAVKIAADDAIRRQKGDN